MSPAGQARVDTVGVAILVIFAVALGPLATDLYLPSLPSIGRAFERPAADVQLTLSVFLMGFAVAQLVVGPLSDRFGRRPVLLGGLLLFLLASAFCAFAWSLEVLLAGRLVQALGACAGPVLGRAVVRDAWGAERAARVLSYLASAMAIAPAAGPVIGGFLESYLGWRSNFFALSLYALVLLLLLGYRLPETNRYRDETALRPMRIVGNYVLLLRHRSYLGYLLIVALAYSGIFVFISGSSFLLIETLGLTPQAFGLSFAGAVGGYVVGSLGSGRFSQRFGSDRILVFGVAMGCLAGTVGLTLALSGVLSVVSVVGSTALFFLAAGCLLPNAFAGALRHYPHMAGSASSLLGFVQMALASAIGMAVGALHDGTHLPMAGATALIAAAIAASWAFLIRPGLVQDRLRQAA